MIRLVTWGKAGPVILLGVTEENIERMRAGDPIHVRLREFSPVVGHLADASLAIAYGKTHRAIVDDLTRAGMDVPAEAIAQAEAIDADQTGGSR